VKSKHKTGPPATQPATPTRAEFSTSFHLNYPTPANHLLGDQLRNRRFPFHLLRRREHRHHVVRLHFRQSLLELDHGRHPNRNRKDGSIRRHSSYGYRCWTRRQLVSQTFFLNSTDAPQVTPIGHQSCNRFVQIKENSAGRSLLNRYSVSFGEKRNNHPIKDNFSLR